VLDTQEYA
jgi:hypothetical protein